MLFRSEIQTNRQHLWLGWNRTEGTASEHGSRVMESRTKIAMHTFMWSIFAAKPSSRSNCASPVRKQTFAESIFSVGLISSPALLDGATFDVRFARHMVE